MRRLLKFLHSIAACGLIGALAAYAVVLLLAPQDTPQAYAAMRLTVAALASHLLIPSMAVAIVTGLIAMAVHYPFAQTRWAWMKALLGLGIFEATLGLVQSKATAAADAALEIASGSGHPGAIEAVIANEWMAFGALLTLSITQVALGVWRPSLSMEKRPG
jgi:uncharacterized membrane protein